MSGMRHHTWGAPVNFGGKGKDKSEPKGKGKDKGGKGESKGSSKGGKGDSKGGSKAAHCKPSDSAPHNQIFMFLL